MTIPHHYSMKWDNYHSHVGEIFSQLLETGSMADVVLYAEGEKINCHKMLLSACSPYFQKILSTAGSSNTIVVVSGIHGEDVRSIIEFVYRGEISVKADRFTSVLKAAEALKICGLMEVSSHLSEMEESEIMNCQNVERGNTSVKEEVNHSVDRTDLIVKEEKKNGNVSSPENPWNCIEMPLQSYKISESDRTNCSLVNNVNKKEIIMTDLSVNDCNKPQLDVTKKLQERDINIESNCEGTIKFKVEAASVGDTPTKMVCVTNSEEESLSEEMKLKRRKEIRKKLYSEEAMSAALDDMKSGKNLVKAAAKHCVPRTTLYMRARAIGACPVLARKGYPREKITAALESVAGGSSLQCAATEFGIPKTVLWRRVQKEIGSTASHNKRLKPTVPSQVNSEDTVLQEGVSITRVSPQYQIPKATLFRWEKVHLTGDEMKIPKSLIKETCEKDLTYELRLDTEDTNSGAKSDLPQHCSPEKFKELKPPLWHKIDSNISGQADQHVGLLKNENEDIAAVEQLKQQQRESDFQFSEVSGVHELPVSFVNNGQFTESPLIILAPVNNEKYSVKEQNNEEVSTSVNSKTVSPSFKVENKDNDCGEQKNPSN